MTNFFEKKEEAEVSGAEFSSEGGLITWREIYRDGSSGAWENTSIETNDMSGLKKLRRELQEKYGDNVKI